MNRMLIAVWLCLAMTTAAAADRPAGHTPKRKTSESPTGNQSAFGFLRSMLPQTGTAPAGQQAPNGQQPGGASAPAGNRVPDTPRVQAAIYANYPKTATPSGFAPRAIPGQAVNPVTRIAAQAQGNQTAQVAYEQEAIPSFNVGAVRVAPSQARPPQQVPAYQAQAQPAGNPQTVPYQQPAQSAARVPVQVASNPSFQVPAYGQVKTTPPGANDIDGLLPFGVNLEQAPAAAPFVIAPPQAQTQPAQPPHMNNPFLREERVAQNAQTLPPAIAQPFAIPVTNDRSAPFSTLSPVPGQQGGIQPTPVTETLPAPTDKSAQAPAGSEVATQNANELEGIPADAQIIYDSANPHMSPEAMQTGEGVYCQECEGPCHCGLVIPGGRLKARRMGMLPAEKPHMDYQNAPYDARAFSPNPQYGSTYNPEAELGIYEFKWNQCSQRPLVELGRGLYRDGPVPQAYSFLGRKNLIVPGFTIFGDYRTGIAYNDNGAGNGKGIWAHRLNLDFDLEITATERIHAFWGPLDEDGRFTRAELSTDGRDELDFIEEFDDDFDTLFFEGDLGYIWGGMTDQFAPFDLPFVAGKFPLLFQNGIWMNDAIEGFAFTFPARNAPLLKWSNYEVTYFFGFDDVDNPTFGGDDNAADVYGANYFIEAWEGYYEIGHAFLKDRTNDDRSHHNVSFAYTRRYRQRLNNSVRFIANFGQDKASGPRGANGQLLLIENSLVTSNRDYFVPYLNLFAGWGTPQSVARVGGILTNTGINFETDALTGFPKLDDRANDTYGAALGFNLLGPRFSWQWILEAAVVQNFGNTIAGDEYAIGTRFQLPINYAWILRFDGMYGHRENTDDISGVRMELRWKF